MLTTPPGFIISTPFPLIYAGKGQDITQDLVTKKQSNNKILLPQNFMSTKILGRKNAGVQARTPQITYTTIIW